MLKSLTILPLFLCASPALAQSAAAPESKMIRVPSEIADPAMADRLARTVQAMSTAVLNLPVGEVQAAVEGRPATAAERRMTVRDMARKDDPDFDRRLQQQVAQVGPMMRQSVKALNDALPAMMQGLEQAGKALERAAANMPDPTYPKR